MAAIALAGLLSDKPGSSNYDSFGPVNKAHHYTIAHGWNASLWFGLAFAVLGIVFIPFLLAWARSEEPLHALSPAAEGSDE